MKRRESAALISIACNMLLVALKLLGAFLSGSIALLADAWHSSSDIAVSALVWTGIKLTGEREERRGAACVVENGVAIIISLAIFFAAVAIFRKIYISGVRDIRRTPEAMAIVCACIFISLFVSRYKILVGRDTASPSLVADGQHSRIDMYTSIAVLAVLVGSMIGVGLDRPVAVVITLLILKVGIEVFATAVSALKRGEVLRFRPAGSGRPGGLAAIFSGHARAVAVVLALVILGCYLLTAVTVVSPAQKGLLSRFGRFVGGVKTPGVYLHWPFPFERIVTMEPERVRRIEFGFRSNSLYDPSREPQIYEWENRHVYGRYRKAIDEALMLTGDENVIDINFILHYSVSDMRKFLTRVSDDEKLVRDAAESAMRLIVGTDEMEDILTRDRDAVQERLRASVQETLDSVDAGIEIIGVWLQDVHPPIDVVSAFRDVASAREDKARVINEALAHKNDAIPRARGEAHRDIADAEARKFASVERAKGDAALYVASLAAYETSPGVTRVRLVWETLEEALRPVEKYFLKPDPSGKAQLWLIPTGKEPVDFEEIMKRMSE